MNGTRLNHLLCLFWSTGPPVAGRASAIPAIEQGPIRFPDRDHKPYGANHLRGFLDPCASRFADPESQITDTASLDAALMDLGFGPDERPGVFVVGLDESIDMLPQLRDRGE